LYIRLYRLFANISAELDTVHCEHARQTAGDKMATPAKENASIDYCVLI